MLNNPICAACRHGMTGRGILTPGGTASDVRGDRVQGSGPPCLDFEPQPLYSGRHHDKIEHR